MKNLYNIAVIYCGDLPVENPNSLEMNRVVMGDILIKYNIQENSKVNAYIKAKELWNVPDPELDIFRNMGDDIMFICSVQK